MLLLSTATHYRAASAALGRPVDSLAALTEPEGRGVCNHARALVPGAVSLTAVQVIPGRWDWTFKCGRVQ